MAPAPTTDELRAELIAEVATLFGAELVAVRAEIIASEQALRALADDPDAQRIVYQGILRNEPSLSFT